MHLQSAADFTLSGTGIQHLQQRLFGTRHHRPLIGKGNGVPVHDLVRMFARRPVLCRTEFLR